MGSLHKQPAEFTVQFSQPVYIDYTVIMHGYKHIIHGLYIYYTSAGFQRLSERLFIDSSFAIIHSTCTTIYLRSFTYIYPCQKYQDQLNLLNIGQSASVNSYHIIGITYVKTCPRVPEIEVARCTSSSSLIGDARSFSRI